MVLICYVSVFLGGRLRLIRILRAYLGRIRLIRILRAYLKFSVIKVYVIKIINSRFLGCKFVTQNDCLIRILIVYLLINSP